jgi:hypothetical protein
VVVQVVRRGGAGGDDVVAQVACGAVVQGMAGAVEQVACGAVAHDAVVQAAGGAVVQVAAALVGPLVVFFFFSKKAFAESDVGAPRAMWVRRETFAESKLSTKASTRGKAPSLRVTSLSAKALNPVVFVRSLGRHAALLGWTHCVLVST